MLEKAIWESKKILIAFSDTAQSDQLTDDALTFGNIVVRISAVGLAAPGCGVAPSWR
jgi:hypothetical protein